MPYFRARSGRSHVEPDQWLGLPGQPPLPLLALGAERVGELDEDLVGGRPRAGEVGDVDPVVVPGGDPAQPGGELVDLAAGAEVGDRGEQRQRRDHRPEHSSHDGRADPPGDRGGGEERGPHHVGEPRRPRILQRPLADPRLDQFVVDPAGKAPPAPERQPECQLHRHQRPKHRPAEDATG
jgi:hypothetical protein